MKMTIAQVIINCLEQENIEYAFGIAGSHYLAFFYAMKESKIKFISVKHESAAGFMALNYAKVAQKPALVLGTAGPGAMNLLNGIAELYKAGIPAIILTPLVPRFAFGKNSTQEDTGWGNTYSIMDIMKVITKKSILANLPEKVPDLLHELFRFGFSEHPGPVHIGIPSDLFEFQIEYNPIKPHEYRITEDERVENNKLNKLGEIIKSSRNPLLIIGERTVFPSCSKELSELINEFKIPFITTQNAKGIIDENSKLFAGVLDIFGHKSAEKVLKECDLAISIGADFNEETTLRFDPDLLKNCNHISIDSDSYEIGRNYKVAFGINGNIKNTVLQLIRILKSLQYISKIDEMLFKDSCDNCNSFFLEDQNSNSIPIKPQAFFSQVSKCIPQDSLVFIDVGSVAFWSTRNFKVSGFKYYISANGFSMGQSVSGCIGGKAASPEKNVICICGDGSFMMNGMEIATAKQYGIGIIWIIFTEGKYNIIDFGQKMFFEDKIGYCAELFIPDFSKFAEAFSIGYYHIKTIEDISSAMEKAINRPQKEQSVIITVEYDVEEFLPVKPQAVRKIQDLRNTENFKTSRYFMKAFKNIIKEKI
jgi:acetolactate synthase-1/2/3 large subunit